jgi:hypothetical protein
MALMKKPRHTSTGAMCDAVHLTPTYTLVLTFELLSGEPLLSQPAAKFRMPAREMLETH